MSTIKREVLSIPIKRFIDDYIYRIDIDADYQREKIWSKRNQEELLDSIIHNIDIPKIYLAKVRDDEQFDYECIDGKQRMTALLGFFKPEDGEDNPLRVGVTGEMYTYRQLKDEHPKQAAKIENFELTFVIYHGIDNEEFLRLIFRRLQLGVRLNSGETLKAHLGTIRDFIFKEIGNNGPFFRYTKLSDKRSSRPFTLAQICINSFERSENGTFCRARLSDLEEFFKDHASLEKDDEKLHRIKEVLTIMDKAFREQAEAISSRAAAVSAYLFVEGLYIKKKTDLIPQFVKFYFKLLDEIKKDMESLRKYEIPRNSTVLEKFQKYILQASVEPYSIRERDEFLKTAFKHYLNSKTQGEIIQNMSDFNRGAKKQ